MWKSAKASQVKTSYSNEFLPQSWLMKSLPSDPGVKNMSCYILNLGATSFIT